ncbi:MAG TPA: substrate-binding domain-containing protein [Candidatus Merdenecus merdavium]|nr:substrate-binding domain-containing protein [Candidatus Merdenecus merdavium]
MATIKEIAKLAGVSIGTVDRVIHDRGLVNEQTKKKVLSVIKELNYKPNAVAQGLAVRKKKLKFCFFIPDSKRNPYFHKVYEAARKKAEELKQYGIQVVFHFIGTESIFLDSADNISLDYLDDIDGIAMIGLEIMEINLCLDKAKERDIPVVFYNTIIPDRDYLAFVGCNYVDSGRMAAGLIALAGGEDAQVCIYTEGPTKVRSCSDRLLGFQNEVEEKYPRMKLLEVCKISSNQIDNYLSVKDMIQKYPDVNIMYIVNPADYGICEAIHRADEKNQIKIITNDLVKEQVDMIRQGIISATVCQEPEKQGSKPLEILFNYLALGKTPEEKMCYTNLSIHIAQNI